MKRKRIYKCEGCNQRQALVGKGPHYCKCNAIASFRMTPLIVLNVTDKMFGKNSR